MYRISFDLLLKNQTLVFQHVSSCFTDFAGTMITQGTTIIHTTWLYFLRFENTVTAQFNGHSHRDHFYIYYAIDEPTRANNVAFNGGSVTPFSNLNPNYKAYSMDSANYVRMSHVKEI